MTFRIAQTFDRRYNCPTGHNSSDGIADVDRQTWTCPHCHLSLMIEMSDAAGAIYVVERHLVKTISQGDLIVYDLGNGRLACGEVYISKHATGKFSTPHWHLRVEGFGNADIPAGQLVNRI